MTSIARFMSEEPSALKLMQWRQLLTMSFFPVLFPFSSHFSRFQLISTPFVYFSTLFTFFILHLPVFRLKLTTFPTNFNNSIENIFQSQIVCMSHAKFKLENKRSNRMKKRSQAINLKLFEYDSD